jgi:hypothetical protein
MRTGCGGEYVDMRKITGGWRHSSPNVISVIKSRRMRLAEHITEIRN